MKKVLILVITVFLACSGEIIAQQRTCEMERISLIRVPIPMTVRMPAGLERLSVAVDELGNIYASFSIWQAALDHPGTASTGPYLIKYDPTGKFMQTFRMPGFLSEGPETAQITSIAYQDSKVYALALWGEGQGGILVFESTGKLERVINLNRLSAYKVRPGKDGVIYVLGAPRKGAGSDSQMIFKLSPSGEIMASFSLALGGTRGEPSGSPQPLVHNELLVDESGQILHVLPDGEVRIFNPDGTLTKTLRKNGMGQVSSAFWDGKNIVISRVDMGNRRAFTALVDEEGKSLCEVETTGQLLPMFKGADGYYYGVGRLGVPPTASAIQLDFLVAKFRRANSKMRGHVRFVKSAEIP